MTDKDELKRRKIFAKRAREIIAAWPGYAQPLPGELFTLNSEEETK